MEYKKNDLTVTIEDMGHDGEGIGKVDGYTVFVKDTVIGDKVQAKIMKAKKNYGYARLVEMMEPSTDRVEPRCAYARQCGGCQIQALSYENSWHFKQQKIENNLIGSAVFRKKRFRWSLSSAWKIRTITETKPSFRWDATKIKAKSDHRILCRKNSHDHQKQEVLSRRGGQDEQILNPCWRMEAYDIPI